MCEKSLIKKPCVMYRVQIRSKIKVTIYVLTRFSLYYCNTVCMKSVSKLEGLIMYIKETTLLLQCL